MLDTGEIDFHVMNILEYFYKNTYVVASNYARHELIISPLFEALFDCNIIWKSKYYEDFGIEYSGKPGLYR